MSLFYPPPMGHPGWYRPAGAPPAAAWYPAAPAPPQPAWHPAAGAPYGMYSSPGWGSVPEPVMVEWMALVEPALNSVIPAIHGLLQLSGMLLRHLPATLDMPGSEPAPGETGWLAPDQSAALAPGEPPTVSCGLGHAGLFGPAGSDVIDIDVADAGADDA